MALSVAATMHKRVIAGFAIGLASALLSLVFARTPAGQVAEGVTFDWRMARAPTPVRSDIAIVEINESTLRALAPIAGRWPWPRVIHSGVVNYLARSRARAIVYDIQFPEADVQGRYQIGDRTMTGQESDAEWIATVRRAGNVVLLADAVFEELNEQSTALASEPPLQLPGTTYAPGPGLVSRPSIHPPFPELLSVAASAGHNRLQKDAGGGSRAMFPFLESRGVAVPSLGMASALLVKQVPSTGVELRDGVLQAGDASLPLRGDGQLLLKIHGPYVRESSTTSFPVYSFFDVLLSEERERSGQPPAIPQSAFEGKIVFVGATASGLGDVHSTAFGGSTPGVMLQATLADNVLSRDFMRQSAPGVDLAVTIAAAFLAAVAAMALPVWIGLSGVIALSMLGMFVATKLVAGGVWVAVVSPLVAVTLTVVGSLAWQFFVEGREKRAVKGLFGRYVSPAIFQQLMTNPAVARIGGDRREMTVLFSDIRGFTAASETGHPEAIVAQLNEYLGEMVEVLFRHQGTLDKFVGDQVMGLFGAPVHDERHADHAVAAAIEMSTVLDRLNAQWKANGQPAFEIGIGVNSGDMIAGNVGSNALMSYTVIGDAVNLGARIESLNKEFGTRILISQATKDRLTTNVPTRHVGEAHVKGRREPVVVYEVTSRSDT